MELGKLLTLSALLFASAFGKRESDNVLHAPIPDSGEYDQQTPDKCLHIFYTSRCSTPSLQKLVDSMSTCGIKGKESIRSFEMSCRQNAQGEYCGELSTAIPELEVVCSSDCSVECYDLLNRLNSSIGCCLEFFIFSNPYGILPKSFKLCDLPIPSPCPPVNITIPEVTVQDLSCDTNDDIYLKKYYTAFCEGTRPAHQDLESTGCYDVLTVHNSICSSEKSEYCSSKISKYDAVVKKAIQNCPLDSDCSTQCRNLITSLHEYLGCCVNVLEISELGMWSRCGVDMPDICDEH